MAKSYNREAALRFPLLPGAHDVAWRYLFDWCIAGQALECAPGDLVLEFGAGPAYASELLNRLGYRTVALDLDPEIMGYAAERMTLDQRLAAERSSFVAGDGLLLPFTEESFDGVLCLNALHHMPSFAQALGEIRRALKPGCRAVFSEPGSTHSQSLESRQAVEQYGAVERDIVLGEIHALSLQAGFHRMSLKPLVYPQMLDLDYGDLQDYRDGRSEVPFSHPDEIAGYVDAVHSVFVLTVPGERPRSSARPGLLRAGLTVEGLVESASAGDRVTACVTAQNTGGTLWLASPREFGGQVTVGVKLLDAERRLVTDTVGRTPLAADVPPGATITTPLSIDLPDDLALGRYWLVFDMVGEQITWFELRGSAVSEHPLVVVDAGADMLLGLEPRSRRSAATLDQTRASYATATEVAGQALAALGVEGPSERLLEPIAYAIRALSSETSSRQQEN